MFAKQPPHPTGTARWFVATRDGTFRVVREAENVTFAQVGRDRRKTEVADWRSNRGQDNTILIGDDDARLARFRGWLETSDVHDPG